MSGNNSAQDKSERPSEQKLRRARREGQVARSRELTSAVLIGLGGLLMLWAAPRLAQFAWEITHLQLELSAAQAKDPGYMALHLYDVVVLAAGALLPVLALSWLALVVVGAVPGGWLLSWSLLEPKFSRINPLSGLKRLFSLHSWVELLKSLAKVSLFFAVLAYLLVSHWQTLLLMNRQPVGTALGEGLKLLALALLLMGGVTLLIAVLDVPAQRWSLLRKLRMTKQEVRDEHKQNEGKPEIKARIRQLQMQFSRQRIDQRVPKADVILTNPTHYAVAIQYDPAQADAPFVVAKGVDRLALHIREVGERHGKTVLELPELTRALYYSARVDQEVPVGLYSAVAHVLMYVMQLQAWRDRRGQRPQPLPMFHIPESLRR